MLENLIGRLVSDTTKFMCVTVAMDEYKFSTVT